VRIAITGATGFIGTHLVRYWMDTHRLMVLGRDREKLEHAFQDDPVQLEQTAYNEDHLAGVFDGVEAVVHLAAWRPQSGDSVLAPEPLQVNPPLTGKVLRAAGPAGVDTVCRTSTILVYPREDGPFTEEAADPFNAYGVSRYAGDQLGEMADGEYPEMNVVSLRLGSVYGRGGSGVLMDFVQQAKNGEALTVHGQGESIRDFIHVDDVTRAIEQSLTAEVSGIFNIGAGGDTISDVAETVARGFGTDVQMHYDTSISEDVFAHVMDCSRANKELGWTMEKPLHDGIMNVIDRMRFQRDENSTPQ